MATYTNNMGLIKPDLTDTIAPTPFNENFDAIDNAFGNIPKSFISGLLTLSISSRATGVTLLSDNRITSDSLADVYFTSDTYAYAETLSSLKVETESGSVKATFDAAPSAGTISYRIHVKVV